MSPPSPNWDHLYETASAQDGLFTTAQAAEAGYSLPLMAKHQAAGRVRHVRRGIYRLVHFPPGDHEDLTTVWLWSQRQGVFSMETALFLHNLSDVLPSVNNLTLPLGWNTRRLRVPDGVMVNYADVPDQQRVWVGTVPVTDPLRTMEDCIAAHVRSDMVGQATSQARARGLISAPDAQRLRRSVKVGKTK